MGKQDCGGGGSGFIEVLAALGIVQQNNQSLVVNQANNRRIETVDSPAMLNYRNFHLVRPQRDLRHYEPVAVVTEVGLEHQLFGFCREYFVSIQRLVPEKPIFDGRKE